MFGISIPRCRPWSLQWPDKIGRPRAASLPILLFSLTVAFVVTSSVLAAGSNPTKEDCEMISEQMSGHWKKSERWAWLRICRGGVVNFDGRLKARLKPSNPTDERWNDSRRLDPDFLRTILVQEPYRYMVGEHGINIIGAYFPTGIDLAHASIRHRLRIHRSLIKRSIKMERLTTSEKISFTRVNVTGEFDLDFATTGNDIKIGHGTFERLRLRGAEVGGNLDLKDSTFRTVELGQTRVSGAIDMRSARINRFLDMKQATIQGDVVMRSTELCTRAKLVYTDFGGTLDLRGSSHGQLDLTRARVANALILGKPDNNKGYTRCRDRNNIDLPMKLILQDASVGLMKDTKDYWDEDLDRELDGFRYSRLGEIGKNKVHGPYSRGSEWFVQWLAGDETYTPQPYVQLARVMEASGRDDMASDIRFARWERKRLESAPSRFRWWLLTALRWTMAYGQGWGNLLALAWVAAFTVIGTIVLRISGEVGKDGKALGFWYSLDMLLPVVQLHGLHYETHLATTAKYYFMLHRLFGYILVFLVVTGLTTVLADIIQ